MCCNCRCIVRILSLYNYLKYYIFIFGSFGHPELTVNHHVLSATRLKENPNKSGNVTDRYRSYGAGQGSYKGGRPRRM